MTASSNGDRPIWDIPTVENLPIVTPRMTPYVPNGAVAQQLDKSNGVALFSGAAALASLVIALLLPTISVVSGYGFVWGVCAALGFFGSRAKTTYTSKEEATHHATASAVLGIVCMTVVAVVWLVWAFIG